MEEIGVVTRLRRYPVKSMAGDEVSRVLVNYTGLVGDRVYALLGESEKKSFPWLTARQRPSLVRYLARFETNLDPEAQYPDARDFAVRVRSPSGAAANIEDPQFLDLLRSELGCEIRLRFSERGMQDARPLSIIGESTIDLVGREVGVPLDPRRFRANLYVKWSGEEPFFEDSLVDRRLQIGDKLTVLVSKKDPRCKIIGVDPETAQVAPAVLEAVSRKHGGCAGVYAVVLREGVVEQGAPIRLL